MSHNLSMSVFWIYKRLRITRRDVRRSNRSRKWLSEKMDQIVGPSTEARRLRFYLYAFEAAPCCAQGLTSRTHVHTATAQNVLVQRWNYERSVGHQRGENRSR